VVHPCLIRPRSQLRRAKSPKRPSPPRNPLNRSPKPPLRNSPSGSFFRATHHPRRLTSSPRPRPLSSLLASFVRAPLRTVGSFVRAPLRTVGSFVRIAPSLVPKSPSTYPLSPSPSHNRPPLRPQRPAAPPDMPKSPLHSGRLPFQRPKCARYAALPGAPNRTQGSFIRAKRPTLRRGELNRFGELRRNHLATDGHGFTPIHNKTVIRVYPCASVAKKAFAPKRLSTRRRADPPQVDAPAAVRYPEIPAPITCPRRA
jgi:hypothetical protein